MAIEDDGYRYSLVRYATNGVQTDFTVNFLGGWLRGSDIRAASWYTDDESDYQTHAVTIVSEAGDSGVLRVSPALPVGRTLELYRLTQRGDPMVDFANRSMLTADNLNLITRQAVFAVAELGDRMKDLQGVSDFARFHTLRSEYPIPALPNSRAGRLLGFDDSGYPVTVAPVDGSVGSLAMDLASTSGAGMIGTSDPGISVQQAIANIRAHIYGVFNVRSYGALGNGSNDDTAAIQAAINAAQVNGGTVYLPAGRYRITGKLFVDVRGITGAPNSNRRRLNFRGDGKGNTVLAINTNDTTCLHLQGDNPLTTASHAYCTFSDFSFAGNSPTPRNADGLWLQDVAYLTVRDVSFHNLRACIKLDGCLSSGFYDIIMNESTKGVVANAGASGPHSNVWVDCEFRSLTELGYDGYTTVSGLSFLNCRFEACGTAGVANTGAFRQTASGSAGEHGVHFTDCYIEGNRGDFDIRVNSSTSQRVSVNLTGCCLNRVSSTNFVTHNIVVTGNADLNLQGNTFTSYNTYVPDISRPYLNVGSSVRVRDLGNRWEDAVETIPIGQSVPYAGIVLGSLGAGVTGMLPNGWSVSQVSTGLFQVIHNLGTTDYALQATVSSGNNRVVERVVRNTNSFQVKVTNVSNANADDDFTFSLQILKSVR